MSPKFALNAASMPPELYRSEAFVEDLDLLPVPWVVDPATRPSALRLAGWLLAVPGAVAVLAGAVVIATLPA
jgi:hypothetical protein